MENLDNSFQIACGTVYYVGDGTTRVSIQPGYFSDLNVLISTNNIEAALCHHTYRDFVECVRYDMDPDKLFVRAYTLSNLQTAVGVSRSVNVSCEGVAEGFANLVPEEPKCSEVVVDTYDNTDYITYNLGDAERQSSAPSNEDGYDPDNNIGRFYDQSVEYDYDCADGDVSYYYGGGNYGGVGADDCSVVDCTHERGYREVIYAYLHIGGEAASVLYYHYFKKPFDGGDPYSMGYCYFLFFQPAVREQFFVAPLKDMPRILNYSAWAKYDRMIAEINFSQYVAFKLRGSFVHLIPLGGNLDGYIVAPAYKLWRALGTIFNNPDIDYKWNGETFVYADAPKLSRVSVGRQIPLDMEDIFVRENVATPAVRSVYIQFEYNNGIVGLHDVMMTNAKLVDFRSFIVNFDLYVQGLQVFVNGYGGHYSKLDGCITALSQYLHNGVHENVNNLVGAFKRCVRSYVNIITNNAIIRDAFIERTVRLPWLFKRDERFLKT